MKCYHCSNDIPDGSQFCNFCGRKQEMVTQIKLKIDTPSIKQSEKSRSPKKMIVLALSLLCVLLLIIVPLIKTNQRYNEAVSMAEQGNYREAAELFYEIKDSKESDILDFVTNHTERLCESNSYSDARLWLSRVKSNYLISTSNATELENMIEYTEAEYMVETGNYIDAYYRYVRLDAYKDSEQHAAQVFENNKEDFYELAVSNYELGTIVDYKVAQSQFEKLDYYKDSAEYLSKIEYLLDNSGTYENCRGTRYIFNGLKYSPAGTSFEYDLQLAPWGDEYCLYEDGTAYVRKFDKLVKYDARMNDKGEAIIDIQKTYEWDYLYKISDNTSPLRDPAIGMTTDEVILSTWGSPKEINKTVYTWGVSEQWVYSGYRYIYFENGIVTAIQD